MCLSILIFLGFGTQSITQGKSPQDFTKVKISLQVFNVRLAEVLNTIEDKTAFKFVYSTSQINQNRLVSIAKENTPVVDILRELFKGQGRFSFKQSGNHIVISSRNEPIVYIPIPKLPKKEPEIEQPKVGNGIVKGKVSDAINNEPLPGTAIFLKNTAKGTASDYQGEYQINLVPEGEQTLVVSYIGYSEQEFTVNVVANQITTLNIALKPNSSELGEVIIKGSLEGQEKALNQQKTADNIKNIVSADLIGRFPDLNVAEALQRIPGINIERDRGEGGEVQMRGAPSSFTTININGEQIPGTQPDGARNEELSVIPVDQLSSIEVTKAITSDQDGDNIGGTVDLKTPMAKSLKARAKMEVGGGYNNIVEKLNFIGKASYNQRFLPSDKVDDGRLGINIGGSFFASDNGRDRSQYNYNSQYTNVINPQGEPVRSVLPTYYRLRDLENERTRTGLSGTIDYKLGNKGEIYANVIYSRRFDRDLEKRVQYDLSATNITNTITSLHWSFADGSDIPNFNNNSTIRRFVNPRTNEVTNLTYSFGGNYQFGKLNVDAMVFISDARNSADKGRTYDLRSGTTGLLLSDFYTDYANVSSPGNDVHDPFFITDFRDYVDRENIIEAKNFSSKINFSLPYEWKGNSGLLKFGGKYRTLNNKRNTILTEFDYVGSPAVNESALWASWISNREDQQFFVNRVRYGPMHDPAKTDAFIRDNPGLFRPDPVSSLTQTAPQFYDADEDVYAAYVMSKLQVKKWMFLAGFRYERTNIDYIANQFNQVGEDVLDGSVTSVNGGTGFDFFLPNVHVKYSVDKNTNLRAALTWSFARSSFVELAPTQRINIVNQTIDLGNPDLLPARSLNFDILFEKYLKNVGIISGGVFYKRINDFNYQRTFTEDRTVRSYNDITQEFEDVTLPFTIEQAQNGDRAILYGAEINIQANLDFLPGMLAGLGVYANYTYTKSDANTFERENVRLPGQATHTGNFALSYDWKGFSARASFNFNGGVVRSLGPDLVRVGGTNTEPVLAPTNGDFDTFRADRYQLDISASYKIWKELRVYAEFINLTNRPELEYIGIRSRPINIEIYDWWNRFGISYSF
jgi:TonB-dependent receptor